MRAVDRFSRSAGLRRRDVQRRRRYGREAPRYHELIWIDPRQCRLQLLEGRGGTDQCDVLDGDWDRAVEPLENNPHIRVCLEHWLGGRSWEETGAYDDMMERIASGTPVADGCRTLDDVVARYHELDEVFERVRREGLLRTRAELSAGAFRERGGVLIHIDRSGEPLYNRFNGCHRLAMALVLELPVMPAQVGIVHADALSRWRTEYQAGGERPPPATKRTRAA